MLLPLILPLLLLLHASSTFSQAQNKVECLQKLWANGARPTKQIYSQYEEDGVLEAIFECIGTTDKYFVEFGTEDGSQCSTRNFREKHGWKGLMMDGSNDNPAINLHKEFMKAENIVELFEKYNVPKPKFDHLTTDIDLNTFYVLRAILAAGYRPRSVITEVNRNFPAIDSYAVEYNGDDMQVFPFTCYFGASPLAYVHMMDHFGYTLVAMDKEIVNMFFVHRDNALDGAEGPFTYPQVVKNSIKGGACWDKIHDDCSMKRWLHIGRHTNFTDPNWMASQPIHTLKQAEKNNDICPGRMRRTFAPTYVPHEGR